MCDTLIQRLCPYYSYGSSTIDRPRTLAYVFTNNLKVDSRLNGIMGQDVSAPKESPVYVCVLRIPYHVGETPWPRSYCDDQCPYLNFSLHVAT